MGGHRDIHNHIMYKMCMTQEVEFKLLVTYKMAIDMCTTSVRLG